MEKTDALRPWKTLRVSHFPTGPTKIISHSQTGTNSGLPSELHPDKTRLIEFGRFAECNRKQRGEGKPETFDFLGFTHICGKTRKLKLVTVIRKTMSKRHSAKLHNVKMQLRLRMHESIEWLGAWLKSVVQCYFNSVMSG